jgi:hypothetical protein
MLINKYLKFINLTWVIRHRYTLSNEGILHLKSYLLFYKHLIPGKEKVLFQINFDGKFHFGE